MVRNKTITRYAKIKGLLLILIAFILLRGPGLFAQNHFNIEYETRHTFDETYQIRPQFNIFGQHAQAGKTFGYYYWAAANKDWGEAYGGLLINTAKWLQVMVGGGLETHEEAYRLNLITFSGIRNWFFMQWYEYGGSGFWYYFLLDYALTANFKAGAILERYYGLGPNFYYTIKNTPVVLNLATLYDLEAKLYRMKVTVRLAF